MVISCVVNRLLSVLSVVTLNVLHILVECLCYGKDFVTFHRHGTLSDMPGDHCHSVSNVLAFFKCSKTSQVNLITMVLCYFRAFKFLNFL